MAERVQPLDTSPEPSFELKRPPPPYSESSPPSNSYIVQFPKDQIYRVPPPENARYVEQYGKPIERKSLCSPRLKWVLGTVVAVAVLISVVLAVYLALGRPNPPTFQIKKVVVKPKSNSKHDYDITLRVENPNSNMGLFYQDAGSATLSHKGQEMASGKPPSFYQAFEDSTIFHLVLTGSDAKLPSDIRKSFEGKESKAGIPLSLSLTLPVRVKKGAAWVRSTNMNVGCDLKVNTLAKGTHVTSQECQSKI